MSTKCNDARGLEYGEQNHSGVVNEIGSFGSDPNRKIRHFFEEEDGEDDQSVSGRFFMGQSCDEIERESNSFLGNEFYYICTPKRNRKVLLKISTIWRFNHTNFAFGSQIL